MSDTFLINRTDVTQVIRLVSPDGKKDSIQLAPKGRAVPPPGYLIDPLYEPQYTGLIKGLDAYKVVTK